MRSTTTTMTTYSSLVIFRLVEWGRHAQPVDILVWGPVLRQGMLFGGELVGTAIRYARRLAQVDDQLTDRVEIDQERDRAGTGAFFGVDSTHTPAGRNGRATV